MSKKLSPEAKRNNALAEELINEFDFATIEENTDFFHDQIIDQLD